MASISRTRTTGYVEVKGLIEAINALGVFVEPRIFNKMIETELRTAAQAVIVPAIKQGALSASRYSPGPGRNRGKRGKRGPLAKTVTVISNLRKYRRNHTEFAAVNVGPRAWYRHFVIQGTQPHSVLKSADVKAGRLQAEGRKQHRFHPGAKPNDFVARAVKGKDAALTGVLGNVPMREYARRLGKRITV